MKKKDVEIGGVYLAKVSNRLAKVRITGESRYGGWDAVNLATRRDVRIRGAARLRRRVDAPAADLKARLAVGVAKLNAMLASDATEAPATTTVAPAATEPALGPVAQEDPGDATLPNTVAQVEPPTNGQEGDEDMSKKQSKKAAKAQAKTQTQGLCPACGRTIRLPNGRGRCECGQAVFARGGKLLRIKETPPGCVNLPAATTLEQPKAPEPQAKAPRKRADGRLSGLDAAAKVLTDAGEPLGCDEMVKRMLEDGLWATEGKTPAATIYAAIIREIAKKGDASRFRKTDRGKFTVSK